SLKQEIKRENPYASGKIARVKPALSIAPKSAAAAALCVSRRNTSLANRCNSETKTKYSTSSTIKTSPECKNNNPPPIAPQPNRPKRHHQNPSPQPEYCRIPPKKNLFGEQQRKKPQRHHRQANPF